MRRALDSPTSRLNPHRTCPFVSSAFPNTVNSVMPSGAFAMCGQSVIVNRTKRHWGGAVRQIPCTSSWCSRFCRQAWRRSRHRARSRSCSGMPGCPWAARWGLLAASSETASRGEQDAARIHREQLFGRPLGGRAQVDGERRLGIVLRRLPPRAVGVIERVHRIVSGALAGKTATLVQIMQLVNAQRYGAGIAIARRVAHHAGAHCGVSLAWTNMFPLASKPMGSMPMRRPPGGFE